MALDLPSETIGVWQTRLSNDEQARAQRYKFDQPRRRFIACRAQVRGVLAGYLGDDPGRLEFRHGPQGKPALAAPWSDSGIEFNVSHSHELALCAVTVNRELGVDVERIRTPHDFEGIAAQFFAPAEVDALRGLPDELRRTAFFQCWTRKEAVLKAVGTGLSTPLNQVVVSLSPGEPAAVLKFGDGPGEWWMQSLDVSEGYVGAIASAGSPLNIERWHIDPGRV